MRRILGLSQSAYAELVGISAQALMDFERGRGSPALKTLRAIAALRPRSLLSPQARQNARRRLDVRLRAIATSLPRDHEISEASAVGE